MKFKEDIKIRDRLRALLRKPGRDGGDQRSRGPVGGAPPIKVTSNVHVKKIRKTTGEVEETRDSHNIFVDYGRDWIAHLIALATIGPDTTFRDDRIRYMAVGIGGTSQLLSPTVIEPTHTEWDGYAQDWNGGAATAPLQVDTDPTVNALEWPVAITDPGTPIYYDDVSAPVTFPSTGVARFTTVLGINEVSFGAFTSVPLSEVGLFTQRIATQTGGLNTPPVNYVGEVTTDKAMVAYNTFDTLSKTSAFVLQFDWEIRFS
jgi:hypothetical protein